LQAGEYFVWSAAEQAHERHPFLFVVLEANHVALQLLWPYLNYLEAAIGVCLATVHSKNGLIVSFFGKGNKKKSARNRLAM
jgi:hypothetical protein